ncbi:unnamed protein product [Lymnaea stagnalis]|uniref:Uncharacterized protein n=1 Tax=Lymnaea stagnalis TaxID=6523 RepID=A0AAV2HDY7_LYMST
MEDLQEALLQHLLANELVRRRLTPVTQISLARSERNRPETGTLRYSQLLQIRQQLPEAAQRQVAHVSRHPQVENRSLQAEPLLRELFRQVLTLANETSRNKPDENPEPTKELTLEDLKNFIGSKIADLGTYDPKSVLELLQLLGKVLIEYPEKRKEITDYLAEIGYANLVTQHMGQISVLNVLDSEDASTLSNCALCLCLNLSACSAEFAKCLARVGAVELLTQIIINEEYLSNGAKQVIVSLIRNSVDVLNNIARYEPNKTCFQQQNTAKALEHILKWNNGCLEVRAMLTLALVMDDDQLLALTDDNDIIKTIVDWLNKACDNKEGRSHDGFSPCEIAESLTKLAANDFNKAKIIMAGGLQALTKMLCHSDPSEQIYSAVCVKTIAQDVHLRPSIVKVTELLVALLELGKSSNEDVLIQGLCTLLVLADQSYLKSEQERTSTPAATTSPPEPVTTHQQQRLSSSSQSLATPQQQSTPPRQEAPFCSPPQDRTDSPLRYSSPSSRPVSRTCPEQNLSGAALTPAISSQQAISPPQQLSRPTQLVSSSNPPSQLTTLSPKPVTTQSRKLFTTPPTNPFTTPPTNPFTTPPTNPFTTPPTNLVKRPLPKPVTAPSHNPVTTPSTNPVTAQSTNKVTTPPPKLVTTLSPTQVTSPFINPVTEQSTNSITPPCNPVTAPSTNLVTAPSTNPITAPSTNPVAAPPPNPVTLATQVDIPTHGEPADDHMEQLVDPQFVVDYLTFRGVFSSDDQVVQEILGNSNQQEQKEALLDHVLQRDGYDIYLEALDYNQIYVVNFKAIIQASMVNGQLKDGRYTNISWNPIEDMLSNLTWKLKDKETYTPMEAYGYQYSLILIQRLFSFDFCVRIGSYLTLLGFTEPALNVISRIKPEDVLSRSNSFALLSATLNSCIAYSDVSKEFVKCLVDAGFIETLTGHITDVFFLDNLNEKSVFAIMTDFLTLLYNIACHLETKQCFKDYKTTEAIRDFPVKNEKIEITVMLTLLYSLDEQELDNLPDVSNVIENIIKYMSGALENKTTRRYSGMSLCELTKGLTVLAIKSSNRSRIASKDDAVAVLAKMLRHNDPREHISSARCLQALAVESTVRKKLLEFPDLVEAMEEVQKSGSLNVRKSVQDALALLRESTAEDDTDETQMKRVRVNDLEHSEGPVSIDGQAVNMDGHAIALLPQGSNHEHLNLTARGLTTVVQLARSVNQMQISSQPETKGSHSSAVNIFVVNQSHSVTKNVTKMVQAEEKKFTARGQSEKLRPEDEQTIRRHWQLLIEQLDATHVIMELISYGVFDVDDKREIMDHASRKKRTEIMLHKLLNAGPGPAFKRFIDVLDKDHGHIVDRLREWVHERGGV